MVGAGHAIRNTAVTWNLVGGGARDLHQSQLLAAGRQFAFGVHCAVSPVRNLCAAMRERKSKSESDHGFEHGVVHMW
jgi:hypothetical protein